MALPKNVGREHVIEAIRLFDAGEPHLFGDSTHYDLVHDGKRYPPKAILGLAGQLATGTQFTPSDFTGGEVSGCFRILRRCGFLVVPKEQADSDDVSFDESGLDLESDGPLEGGKKTRFTTYYERLPQYREEALRHHGYRCMACGIDFEERYGLLGKGFIHVHHNKPVSESGPVQIDPRPELSVVCPNCHAMIHRKRGETLTVQAVRDLLSANGICE